MDVWGKKKKKGYWVKGKSKHLAMRRKEREERNRHKKRLVYTRKNGREKKDNVVQPCGSPKNGASGLTVGGLADGPKGDPVREGAGGKTNTSYIDLKPLLDSD